MVQSFHAQLWFSGERCGPWASCYTCKCTLQDLLLFFGSSKHIWSKFERRCHRKRFTFSSYSGWTNVNQTLQKVSICKWNSSLFKWDSTPFSKGKIITKCENTLMKFTNLLLLNLWANHFNRKCNCWCLQNATCWIFPW